MLYSLLQQSLRAAVVSTTALTTVFLAALPSYSQNLGSFSSGPFRTVSDRTLLELQSLGPDIICGNDGGRLRSFSRRRFYFNRGYTNANTLTNNPLIPNRLDSQRTQLTGSALTALTDDPLVPNRLNSQSVDAGLNQVSSSGQSVNCQTIRNSSITTVNQPLANQSVNITINSGGGQLARNAVSSRTAASGGNLPLSAILPERGFAIANLPDGNYRVTSIANASNDIGLAELSNRGGRLFTFNKSGSTITGNLNDFDGGFSACVTGSVDGNVVTGQAITDDLGVNVLGRNYLDLGLTLALGEQVAGDRYSNSVLNLSGFSRINAGAVTPPARC